MSANNTKLPPGLHLSAVAVSDFSVVAGVNQKGKAYQKLIGRGLAGERFVKVTQFAENGEPPLLFKAGETFEGEITGVDTFEKGREVVSLFVKLRRPALAEVKK